MSKILNTGIIGFGMAGQIFHAPFISTIPGFRLAKISTSNLLFIEKARARYPETEIVTDADGILNDPTIDLVIIGSPNESHAPLATKALMNGKHVIVEKPFTITSAEADALIELARLQNRVLTVHHNRRFVADYQTVIKLLKSGLLGNLVEYESNYDRFRPALKQKAWREEAIPGAGILYDLGSHLIDQALMLFGLPEAITADVRIQRPGGKSDDYFSLRLDYPNLKVNLKASMLAKKPSPHFMLHGDRGSFVKYGADIQEADLNAGLTPLTKPNWGVEPEANWGKYAIDFQDMEMEGVIQSQRGAFPDYFINVRDAIWGEAALLVKPEQSRNTIRVIELAMESVKEKRTVFFSV
jgi:scyllo-inositol 2-dehydrogenase (NADP+)